MNKALLTLLFIMLLVPGIIIAQTFTNVTVAAGIRNPNLTPLSHDGGSATDIMGMGSGAAWFDYDNDGDLDLYLTMRTTANRLYRNNGSGTFTNVAASMGVENITGDGAGVVIADINNDGWLDLFLNNCNEVKLYKNIGGTTFSDITISSGLDGILGDRRGTSGSFGDFNNDGYLDLFVSHHMMTDGTQLEEDRKDFLILNDGDETFTDVSTHLEFDDRIGFGFIAGWTDYDSDGDQDIILINDCEELSPQFNFPTKVFRNDGGTDAINDWTFTEVGDIVGIDDCRNGMGIAVGDYDRDGELDVFYTNIGDVVLFENEDGIFTDVTNGTGLDIQADLDYSWGATFVDYDLDGWQDIFVTLGELQPTEMDDRPNQMFKNNGDGTFTNQAVSLGLDNPRKSRNGIFGDYDGDGDLDLFLVNYGGEFALYRNDVPPANHHWLHVKPQGVESNMDGVGSKVRIVYGDPDTTQVFEVRSGSNLGGGEEIGAFFGLGTSSVIDSIIVTFLSGEEEILLNQSADQKITVMEPEVNLPVEFGSFDVRRKGNDVLLEWTTYTEEDNAKFIIERSNTGRDFIKVGERLGNGNSDTFLQYEFLDEKPEQGSNYYRIKQLDFDGTASFSEIRVIEFSGSIAKILLYPNPANGNDVELAYLGEETDVSYMVYDLFGNNLRRGLMQNGEITKIDLSDLANGMYFVQIEGKQFVENRRLILNR